MSSRFGECAWWMKVVGSLLPLSYTANGFAGTYVADLVYSPAIAGPGAAQGIPTLSQWGMIALSMLVIMFAYRILRCVKVRKPLAVWFAACALSAAVMGKSDLISKAWAAYDAELTDPAGGTLTISSGEARITNDTGVRQQIKRIDFKAPHRQAPATGTPECNVGVVLEHRSVCFLNSTS